VESIGISLYTTLINFRTYSISTTLTIWGRGRGDNEKDFENMLNINTY
jgi:hypothetical protein